MGKIYEIFANNLKMQIFSDEQEKYINDEKRIYTQILLVRLKDDKLIKTTNSLIEEARIIAQEKYQSLGNNKELSRAEKINTFYTKGYIVVNETTILELCMEWTVVG